ncbi:MAG: hypothetical protein HWD60_02035 [Defluviicoccus sp.]|nr:MAG: hypothetical protein HWD60_02035 [Defluviicoccus sp.]
METGHNNVKKAAAIAGAWEALGGCARGRLPPPYLFTYRASCELGGYGYGFPTNDPVPQTGAELEQNLASGHTCLTHQIVHLVDRWMPEGCITVILSKSAE